MRQRIPIPVVCMDIAVQADLRLRPEHSNKVSKRPLDEEPNFQFLLHVKIPQRHQYLTQLRRTVFLQEFKLRNESNSTFFL